MSSPDNDLYLKPKKCMFNTEQVEFLGLNITPGRIGMDEEKLKGIKDWLTPMTVKQTRSFLSFTNFYWKFIDHYSEHARLLNDLMKKDKKFKWGSEQEQAFSTLKEKFTEALVLAVLDLMKPFIMESDASKWALGAVLRQQDMNGDWHPCAYLSKTFDQTQRNYDIANRKLLVIITALETWRHYLQGSPHTVMILSDHKNLTYFKSPQKLN